MRCSKIKKWILLEKVDEIADLYTKIHKMVSIQLTNFTKIFSEDFFSDKRLNFQKICDIIHNDKEWGYIAFFKYYGRTEVKACIKIERSTQESRLL